MTAFIPMARPTGRCFGSKSKRQEQQAVTVWDSNPMTGQRSNQLNYVPAEGNQ